MNVFKTQALPVAAPRRVLALGAYLKNTACLLDGDQVRWSPLHDDLSTPEACRALDASAEALVAAASGPIEAVAHDLHPDFHSTHTAAAWAARLGVPLLPVQHHAAHIAAVQAEAGWDTHEPLVGLALDGVGLGHDGRAWGGEVLLCRGPEVQRVDHLAWLPLPGGDLAAREPWRLAAAVLHGLGRGDQIVPRFGPVVGLPLAQGVQTLLQRRLQCPLSSGAGRWFDAAAGALGLSVRQTHEAQAALALEGAAQAWLDRHGPWPLHRAPTLDLFGLVGELMDERDAARGAARFHAELAAALVRAAREAAQAVGARAVALGGGCFFNRILSAAIDDGLQAAGLRVMRPQAVSCGDAGLALGQAWAAAQALAVGAVPDDRRGHELAPGPAHFPVHLPVYQRPLQPDAAAHTTTPHEQAQTLSTEDH